MSQGWIIAIIILVILIAAGIALYIVGKKAQKKQEEQQEQIDANKQTISMLIIDKKRLKLKDAGLPPMVLEQTPKLMRSTKLPIVKVKVGPQIMNLVCDEKIFDSVPVKKEVKAVVSGIYLTEVRGYRADKNKAPEKKKGLWARTWEKAKQKAGVSQVK